MSRQSEARRLNKLTTDFTEMLSRLTNAEVMLISYAAQLSHDDQEVVLRKLADSWRARLSCVKEHEENLAVIYQWTLDKLGKGKENV